MKKIIKEYGLLIIAIVVILSMLWFVKISSSDTGDKIFAFNNKLGGELTESKAIEHTHSFIKFSTPEDCITDGYDYQKCIICNKQIKVNRDATGHSMTAVVLKEPTYREEGLREYKCETCTYTYQAPIARLIDDEAPTCKIKVGTNFWENIINKVTFGVLFKDSQQVTIEADDKKSGIVSIKYYISRDRELGANELDSVAWQEYKGTFTLETNQQVVLYAKAEDFQGNTTIVGTDGILLDNTPPQIAGITNNGEYYVGTLTITKPSDATMTVGGTPIDGSYTFNNEGNYTVVAKDKVGNTTTYNLKIKKYTTSLSSSTSTVNVTDMTDTNVTITLINGQPWEATSNNTNIATVTRSGNGSSIVIRGINEGTAKVTITSAVNNKYTGATKEITVNVTHQHNYSAYSRTKDPTCTADGTDSRTCSKCGNIDTKPVNKLGHNEVNGGTANIHTKCSRCQVTLKDSSKHVYTSSVTKQPTCTEKGTTRYTCGCGYSKDVDDINALGHDYSGDGICKNCGAYMEAGLYTSDGKTLKKSWQELINEHTILIYNNGIETSFSGSAGIGKNDTSDRLVGKLIISSSVTKINMDAFRLCKNLTSVVIPNSVTFIDSNAFIGCTSLSSVILPNKITKISSSLFVECYNLKSVNIPDSVTSIGSGAFSYCTSLTSVTIPSSVTTIGNNAFYNCTSLDLTMKRYISYVGPYAFHGVKNIYYMD